MVVSAVILLALVTFSAFAVYLNDWESDRQPDLDGRPKRVITNREKIETAIEKLAKCSYYDVMLVDEMIVFLCKKHMAMSNEQLDSPYTAVLR